MGAAPGVGEVPEEALVVLVHDAARPVLPDEVIERVLAPLSEGWDGAVPALPVADALKRAEADGTVRETVDTSGLYAVQTPQAFMARVLREALAVGKDWSNSPAWSSGAGGGSSSSRAIPCSSR